MFSDGEKKIDFIVYVKNNTFDNDDNPYGKFIFHQYTNMENQNDTKGQITGFMDIEIPLKDCG
jgi:hypothetical protein